MERKRVVNTEFITKAAANPKAKKATLTAYRGLSVGAILWIYATFPTQKEFDSLRDWVRSQGQTIKAQATLINDLQRALDVERATSLHLSNGQPTQ